jgi:hypothetical protein
MTSVPEVKEETKYVQLQVLKEAKTKFDEFCLKFPHLKKTYIASVALMYILENPPDDIERCISAYFNSSEGESNGSE